MSEGPSHRFRAEHVGSFIRPPELIQARHDLRDGKISAEELTPIEDRCIDEVIRLQEDAGLGVVTDGEYRRGAFFSHFVKSVAGMTVRKTAYQFHNDAGDSADTYAPYCEGRLRRERGICTKEFAYAQKVARATVKVTMPAPPYVNFLGGRERVSEEAYLDLDEYFADLVRVYREEIAELGRLGCTYVQLDEIPLAMMGDPDMRQRMKELGNDPDALTKSYIRLIADCVAERPNGMTIGLHLCRGNYKGRWLAQGGYDAVAEQLFAIPNVDVYLLEYDSPRAGGFSPLRLLPKGKTVALGLITTKSAALENPDDLKRRIDEASTYAPLDQLALCPECGFATNLTGSPMTVQDELAKLRLLVSVARDVWGTA
ncbi:MAG TPA: 5-methyltetrahydropteroyltriglutamate--homocysteine S-methyltransferase [Alphaproteobacteria bacterium]